MQLTIQGTYLPLVLYLISSSLYLCICLYLYVCHCKHASALAAQQSLYMMLASRIIVRYVMIIIARTTKMCSSTMHC